MAFENGNKYGAGRPRGSKNKRSTIDESMQKKALEQLKKALDVGEAWAVQEVLNRTMPKE
ncbi:hypothetical protein KW438_10240 [Vibrio fluvialis]|nr:hypothetical protein [Vibrio fluvialis]MBY8103929.1 hypothetical protein [Vibrio fluvialis]